MLSLMNSSTHWLRSLKLLLLSSSLLSMAMILKFYVPVVAGILVSDVPTVWNAIVFWFKRPPYLYLLVNFIIISILASSKLHNDLVLDPPLMTEPKLSADSQSDFTVRRAVVSDVRSVNEDFAAEVSEDEEKSEYSTVSDREIDENSERIDRSRLQKEDSMENLLKKKKYEKKPLISSKVGNQNAAKAAATPAGRWSRMNGHDTLDDAWKEITEAPFSRRLDKSDSRRDEEETVSSGPPKVTKPETSFKQELRERKMPSLTEEELNRRVEEFIEKFKEEMRLQREESLKKLELMVNGMDY